TLLGLSAIPIINENDTVTTDEIRFGDNDTLGALVTNLIEADVLVLLTDQAGLHTADPRRNPAATLVQTAQAGDVALEAMARGTVNYSASESARILGKPSSEIQSILGYVDEPELIHRDNMVLIG